MRILSGPPSPSLVLPTTVALLYFFSLPFLSTRMMLSISKQLRAIKSKMSPLVYSEPFLKLSSSELTRADDLRVLRWSAKFTPQELYRLPFLSTNFTVCE